MGHSGKVCWHTRFSNLPTQILKNLFLYTKLCLPLLCVHKWTAVKDEVRSITIRCLLCFFLLQQVSAFSIYWRAGIQRLSHLIKYFKHANICVYICLLEDACDFILCEFGCTLHTPQSACVFIGKHESAQLISWNIYLTACFNVRHIIIFQKLFIFRSLWQEIGMNNTFSLAIFP